jgi:hypothetical protein
VRPAVTSLWGSVFAGVARFGRGTEGAQGLKGNGVGVPANRCCDVATPERGLPVVPRTPTTTHPVDAGRQPGQRPTDTQDRRAGEPMGKGANE